MGTWDGRRSSKDVHGLEFEAHRGGARSAVSGAVQRDKRLSVEETHRMPGQVALARALSKLGVSSRSEAIAQILDGRVAVGGRVVRDPGLLVVPESARITVDGETARRGTWRLLMLHKTRGTVTT